MAKGAASTAGEDICTLVKEARVFVFTAGTDEKPAVTPSSAARDTIETFISSTTTTP